MQVCTASLLWLACPVDSAQLSFCISELQCNIHWPFMVVILECALSLGCGCLLCRSAEAALEVRTSERQAAQAEKEALQHQAAHLETVSATRTAQQLRLLQQRNSMLCEQLLHCRIQLAHMEATAQQVRQLGSGCSLQASTSSGH